MDEVDISSLSLSNRDSSRVNTAETSDSAVNKLYPFLSDEITISYVRQSNILFLMRGPSGCGKTTVVRRLQNLYRDIVVCSADDYFLTANGKYQWDHSKLSEAHLSCQQKARNAAENRRNIVIDNTNIRRWEMAEYYNIAQLNGYIVIVVTPHTPWLMQPSELAVRTVHGLTLQMCERKVEDFRETRPYYWAWFFNRRDSEKLLELAHKFFGACVNRIPDCAQQLRNCFHLTDKDKLEFSEHYGLGGSVKLLHCTAHYIGGRDAASSDRYAQLDVVRRSVGKSFSLKVTGIVVTPCTVCARVDLAGDQLSLYRRDVETDAAVCSACLRAADGAQSQRRLEREWTSSTPAAAAAADGGVEVCSVHSCVHITLGYTAGSQAAQAGDDLLRVRRFEAGRSHVVRPVVVSDARIHYYGDGLCSVQFASPMHFTALFSPIY